MVVSYDTCIIDGACLDSVPHLIFTLFTAVYSWNSLFGIFSECWMCPNS